MSKRALMMIAAVSLWLGSGAPRSEAADAGDSRAAVEAAMRGYAAALKSGPPEAVAAWFTADGELLLPGMAPVHGREAIRAFLAPMAAIEVESVEVGTDAVEVHGNSADLWGTYHQLAGEKGKPKEMHAGRFAALWHQDAGGAWHLARLMMQPVP
jgi:uncharacterized protein (TIGR02246 family)